MTGFAAILVLVSAFFYLIPTFIAMSRDVRHSGKIILINVLFGWTVLGWIAALIWAIVEKPIERTGLEFDEATGLPRGRSN